MTDTTSTDIWGEPTNNESDIVTDDEATISIDESEEAIEDENTENEEGEVVSESNTSPERETFEIKVNGESKTLTRDEIISQAQKGADYDRVKEERDRFKESYKEYGETQELLKALAKESGMNLKDYLSEIKKNMEDAKISDIAQGFINKGIDEDTALQMAQLQYERDLTKTQLDGIKNQQAQQEDMQAAVNEAFNTDVKRLEADGVKVTDELINSLNPYFEKGLTLVEAYQQKEIDDLKKQIETQELNQKNKQRSGGSVKSQAAINGDDDIINALMDA